MVNRMSTRNPLLALLCSLSISYVVSQDWSAVPWWGMGGTRSLYATSAPVAITKNLVYSLSNDTIIASNWRQRGAPAWVSDQLPGLFSNLPVLSTGGVASPDVVYVLAQDGRIYAFDADAGLNKTTPKWRSSFFCTSRVGQEKQVLTVDTTTNLLVARCYSSLVLVSLSTGRNLAYIKDQAIEPLNLPYTFPDKWTIATWRRNSINVWYAVSGYEGKLFRTHTVPDSSFSISSVAAGNGFLVVSGTASPVIYLIEKYGQYTVKYEFKPPGVTNPYVLPRPTIVNGVLYAVVRGTNGDQQVWSLVGLNVNTPRQPTLKFQRPAAEGTPPVQALTYSRNFIYVSEPAVGSQAFPRPNFAGYNMTTGELGWNNVRWSPDTTHPGLAAVTFCCDEMFVSSTIGNTAAARTTAFLRTLRASDGSTYFPSDPYNCTCKDEPAQNF